MTSKLAGFTHHAGKGSSEDVLPHRSALTKLVGGDPLQRTMGNYAKVTPSGLQAFGPSIVKAAAGAGE